MILMEDLLPSAGRFAFRLLLHFLPAGARPGKGPGRPMAGLGRRAAYLIRACGRAALLLLFFPAVCLPGTKDVPTATVTFRPSGVSVTAEKADSPERRATGLMQRTTLGEREGMLFYFDETTYHSFWMYNTPLPLTIIFLDDRRNVVDIQDMEPCIGKSADQCRSYTARFPARYALEVNRGFAARYRIKAGDRAEVKETASDGRTRHKGTAGRRQ
jgi:uncharacterized membrane protein (UPF0127 family)